MEVTMIKKIDKDNQKSLISYITNHKINLSKDARFNLVFNFSGLYTVILLCTIFSVSRSGYYKWKNRKFNPKPNPNSKIKNLIIEYQLMSKFTTGYRKMHIYLSKDKNIDITEYQTYCIMKKYGLLSKSIHSKKNSIINNYLVKYNNLIKGDFSANIPNTKWCIDITKIDTEEGRLYFCAIIDLFDRSIVSYAFHTKQTLSLVSNTIENAIKKSNINNSLPLILHSDQGTQFTSKQYAHLLNENNILGSMSKKATPNDNAVIESFFASLKKEFVYRKIYKTKKEAINDVEFYIFFYNNYRIQLKTGITPMQLRKTAIAA